MVENIVVTSLKKVLANNYALYLKTQNYHWNVTGANFKPLHLMFEEQYNDLFIANDDIAERIRTLGEKVPATFSIFKGDTSIKDGNENASASDMIKELANDQGIMIKSLQDAIRAAQKVNDEVTIGFLIDRMGIHEKTAWMLRSSI